MPGCVHCGRGFCEECHLSDEPCCLEDLIAERNKQVSRKRSWKPDDEIKDPRSTMRKRAQKILEDVRGVKIGDPCEWRGKANCGGGRHPIVGCRSGTVSHVHHGPDKNWFNNSPSNLHGICHSCHNRWHARNDCCYDPTIPHNPRPALEDELVLWNDGPSMPRISHENCPEERTQCPDDTTTSMTGGEPQ